MHDVIKYTTIFFILDIPFGTIEFLAFPFGTTVILKFHMIPL